MWRIEVGFKDGVRDAHGEAVRRSISEDLQIEVDRVRTVQVYTITPDLPAQKVALVAAELFTDPITQRYSINTPLVDDCDVAVEVGFKPGVTDNVGATSVEGIEDLLGTGFAEGETVHTSTIYALDGRISRADAERITTGLLANSIIETFSIRTPDDPPAAGSSPKPIVRQAAVAEVDLDVDDERLLEISRTGVLSLDLDEMRSARAYFQRPEIKEERARLGLGPRPTDVELEMIAQTWSEHCKHKIFNARITHTEGERTERIESLFKTFIKRATDEVSKDKDDWLVSLFTDNAGVVRLDDEHNICFKVETHNHPSALDPYGGALTGIVGVNRDPMGTGLGADLIFNTDVFCFGPPDFPYGRLQEHILHPKRIFKGVRKGVEDGGNKIGIPTVNGAIVFDEAYVYNPLVYCGTGGLMPREINGRPSHEKTVDSGDAIVMVGGRIGKDGIHGATFSSVKLDEATDIAAVQIGAPIVQKRMQDALMEARNAGLFNAITDNGAGGLSSSVGEMAEYSGGAEVDLEKAPTKYPGLDPWELWVSESQERMTLAVPQEKVGAFLELCRRRDVEATVIGKFTGSGRIHMKYEGKTVLFLEMDFLHRGLPGLDLTSRWTEPETTEASPREVDAASVLRRILGSLNVCSKEWVIRQYDHEVQGGTVVKPLVGAENDGPSDAAVVRPVHGSKRGVAVSNGINPRYGLIDTHAMALSAVDEAVRNAVAVGADPDRIAVLDNFCWGNPIQSSSNPGGDFKLAQLVRAAKGCYEAAVGLGTPFISGKDSFHNEYEVDGETRAIPPTLLVSAVGIVPDVTKCVTMDVKRPGDVVYVAGTTKRELGGSHFYSVAGGAGGTVPGLDPEGALELYRAVHAAIRDGLVSSAHDCSEGGLAVSCAESAFAGGLGMTVDLANVPVDGEMTDPEILFSESNARFVLTVPADKAREFEPRFAVLAVGRVGEVTKPSRLKIAGRDGKILLDEDISKLKEAWQVTLAW
ncbi:MAG: phosphoribosylformylglycinamidine synthase subunit PurL [Candidatus Aquicultorales bacterium]